MLTFREIAPRRYSNPLLEAIPSPVRFVHQMPDNLDDFARQPLMDHPQSFSGPVLIKADINNDGFEDVFVGGGSGQASMLYMQASDGSFAPSRQPAFATDAGSHDVDAYFFDANADGWIDLYVGSGGYDNFDSTDPALQDRLYINTNGRFDKEADALPEMRTSTGAVAVHDVNGDGLPDVFVGGGVVPGRYPETPVSYLLVNDGEGRFIDRTDEIAPELRSIGMVRDAEWYDLDTSGNEELVIVGHWMPISVFSLSANSLENVTDQYFATPHSGLWNTVHIEDLNGDDTPDLIAGNLGLNTQVHATRDEPATLYFADFDNNGTVDPIFAYSIGGGEYPFPLLEPLREQVPALASPFPNHASYATVQAADLFSAIPDDRLSSLHASTLETALFRGQANGTLKRISLPLHAQVSPVYAIHAMDYNGDGLKDVLLLGNTPDGQLRLGKYDASYGLLLEGKGQGDFGYVPQWESGLNLKGSVRSLLVMNDTLMFGVNRGEIRAYRRPRR